MQNTDMFIKMFVLNYFKRLEFHVTHSTSTGVGKLRPAGQLRTAKRKSAAREHVSFLNGMRPAKENLVAREHVNVPRRTKIFLSYFFGNLI